MLRCSGRYRCVVSAATVATGNVRHMSVTAPLLQVQHRQEVLESHGAGLVTHESMATTNIDPRLHRMVHKATRAADLFRTKVHEGLGTGPQDPYSRTLPNQESVPPASSVLTSAAPSAPSLNEIAKLPKKWGTMNYWLGDHYPRLPLYLKGLLVRDALPVSPAAERLVAEFEAKGIPSVMEGMSADEQTTVARMWGEAARAYGNVGTSHIFDRRAFVTSLDALHAKTLAAMEAVCPREGIALALEVLKRKAILQRNRFIEDGLLQLVEKGSYYGYGDGVWRVFFRAVEQNKAMLLGAPESQVVGFAWDTLMREDALRTPTVTAPVALYLILLSTVAGKELADAENAAASRAVNDGVAGATAAKLSSEQLFALVNPIVKRRHVAQVLQELLSGVQSCRELSRALRDAGYHDLSREAALCEAMNDSQQLMRADVAGLVTRFDSVKEVKTLLSSLMQGTNDATRKHVASVFSLSATTKTVDWDKVFVSVDWETNWRSLVTTLLSDQVTLEAMSTLVKNAIGAKAVARRLFAPEYAESLEAAVRARKQRSHTKKEKVDHIVRQLSSFQQVDSALAMLCTLGVDLSTLEKEGAAIAEAQRVPRQTVDPMVMQKLLDAIAERHPSWLKASVLPPASKMSDGSLLSMLNAMVRMFVRLAHVPQAGAAAIAQHTRRRIGAIGTQPGQFNVPAEIGHVEQYDNLQYKRYDWQGWYQRMVDVHNRNVSLRCRIDDLKRLDARGNPFVDLQTERRLRILCGDRVGVGVLKLDSDKYEDQSDNITYGTFKLSEIFADSRKAQLGPEYWPTVEVKVRKPSGQSKTHYSTIDYHRIEKQSKELYEKYRDAKKRSLFVTPMDMWLEVKGMQVRKAADSADAEGYTVDNLQHVLEDESHK